MITGFRSAISRVTTHAHCSSTLVAVHHVCTHVSCCRRMPFAASPSSLSCVVVLAVLEHHPLQLTIPYICIKARHRCATNLLAHEHGAGGRGSHASRPCDGRCRTCCRGGPPGVSPSVGRPARRRRASSAPASPLHLTDMTHCIIDDRTFSLYRDSSFVFV